MFGPNNSLAFVLKLGLESGKDSVTVKTVTVKNFMKFHAANPTFGSDRDRGRVGSGRVYTPLVQEPVVPSLDNLSYPAKKT